MSKKIQYYLISIQREILFVCLFILVVSFASGQNQIVFNKTYNNYKNNYSSFGIDLYTNDYAYCSEVVANGYFIGGYSENIYWATDSTLLLESFYIKTNLLGDTESLKIFNPINEAMELIFDIDINIDDIYISGVIGDSAYYEDIDNSSFITKFSNSGDLVWTKKYNYLNSDIFRQLSFYNNNIYVINSSYSQYPTPESRTCLNKMDTSGNILWSSCILDTINLYEIGGFFILNDKIYISGIVNIIDSNDNYINVSLIDTLGNYISSFNNADYISNLSGGNSNIGYYIDSNGVHIIITGQTQLSPNNNAGYVMSVNENFEKEWEQIYDAGPDNELFVSCQVLPDGRIVAISNRTDYEGNYPLSNGSNTDICWLTMLDKHGNTIWNRYISAYGQYPTYTYPYQIKTANDGGFVITGYVINNQIQSNGIFHRNDAWLCKTDSCGFTTGAQPQALLTVDSVKGPNVYISNLSEEYCTAILHLGNGDSLNIYAYSQWTNGTDPTQLQYTYTDTGTYTLTLYTYAGDGIDTFTTQVHISDTTTSIKDVIPAEAGISISLFPNPTKDYVIVAFDNGIPHQVRNDGSENKNDDFVMGLYTPTGQLVQSFTLNPNLLQQRIFLNDLANGVYFVNFTYNGQYVATERLSVVK